MSESLALSLAAFAIFSFTFFFGACIGSFVNACVYRIYHGKNIVNDRSACPTCNHVLGALDLFPILSWLFLRGKCRYCKAKISVQYFFAELLSGTLVGIFSFVTLRNFMTLHEITGIDEIFLAPNVFLEVLPTLILGVLFIGFLIFFSLFDLNYGIIPDKVLFPITIVTFLLVLFYSAFSGRLGAVPTGFLTFGFNSSFFLSHILAGAGAFLFFYLIVFLTKGNGMGMGDVKLVLWFGLVLGWPGIIIALYLAFVIGGIAGAALVLLKIKSLKESVPFGPALCLGAFLALTWMSFFTNYINDYVMLFKSIVG